MRQIYVAILAIATKVSYKSLYSVIATVFCRNTAVGGFIHTKKKVHLENLILELFDKKKDISIHHVARAGKLRLDDPTDRRAIQRAFKALVEKGVIEARGNARARSYNLATKQKTIKSSPKKERGSGVFEEIELSQKSKALLQYVSKPLAARKPVGYDQTFLKSYKPNKTFYLSISQRDELLDVGRVESKVRPAGTYARNILNRLLIDLSWNSSRLEGNTYSLLETQRLIEVGENAVGKDASEAQMILNHKSAIEYIIEYSADKDITLHDVCSIHALLSENLLGDPSASGRLRQIAVAIGGATYLPIDNPHVLKDCFQMFIQKLNDIENPFEQSLFSMVHLPYLQAFEDVNKRTARLIANIPFVKKNLKPLSFKDVDPEAYVKSLLGVYEKTDTSLLTDLYVWAYKRSAQQYSALQQSMAEPNLLKLKFRNVIHKIVRTIIIEKVPGKHVVDRIQKLIATEIIPENTAAELFKLIEDEMLNLHEGSIARFKVRPSEFKSWKKQK